MSTIELIGCTGAGKTTLANKMLSACREDGIEAYLGDDFALRQAILQWIPDGAVRQICVNLVALVFALTGWRRNAEFYRFVLDVISRLPITWTEKTLILRNVLKNTGIREIACRRTSPGQIVVLDEGPVHSAHGLFVHDKVILPDTDLARFAAVVPLPDVIVYLREKPDVLIERATARGHRRIPTKSPEAVERFIGRAVHMFEVLVTNPAFGSRVLIVDGDRHISYPQSDPLCLKAEAVSDILQASLTIAGIRHRKDDALYSMIGLPQ